jgi:transposase
MPRHYIDDSDRRRIVALREEGHSIFAIASRLGASYGATYAAIRNMVRAGRLNQPEWIVGLDGKRHRSERVAARRSAA